MTYQENRTYTTVHNVMADGLHAAARLLTALLLLAGATGALAQTDYSGTYYIASYAIVPDSDPAIYFYDPADPNNTDNYYLCPTDGWIYYKKDNNWTADAASSDGPFLTTFKCRTDAYNDQGGMNNAKWVITKHGDYYTFYHTGTSKYLVLSGQISGCGADRMRVHLEEINSPETPGDNALFTIAPQNQGLYIAPKTIPGDRLTVNGGNQNALTGQSGKTGGPSGYVNTAGIVGIYRGTSTDDNRYFYLEEIVLRPAIAYNSSSLIEITDQTGSATAIYYTTDGTTPTTSSTQYIAPFDFADDMTTVKAIAIVNGEASNVAEFTPVVHAGSSHVRLFQSQNNAWNSTDFHFYMVPGDEASGILKVNTTSLFRPSMEWYFLNAGIEAGVQYYYIVNNANSKYLCYDETNIVYMDNFGSGGNKFKFSIVESATTGTYLIKPYGQNNNLNKDSNNSSNKVINLNNSNTSENTRWKFIASSALDKTVPFTVSDATSTSYYKIASVGSSGYYIVPGATNATTSNSTSDNMNWYFEVAQAANASDWLTYYHIRNAVTGDYLYFTKDANNTGACLATSNTITAGSEDRYKFTWAKTADANVNYYIIPKNLKDISQNQFSALQRDNGTLKTNLTRGAGNYAWTFEPSSYHCIEPEVSYDDAINQIEISSPQGVGVYYTINGANDEVIPSSSTLYTQPLEIGSSSQIVRAVCARSGDGTDNSDVVSIILNPTITLNTGAAITYDGSSHQPTISSVGYNSTNITSECTFAKYLDGNGNEVASCKDAGVYTVVITDADGGDYYVYGSTMFTINKASLTVTPDDGQSKEYGDSDPVLTYISSGLQGGDELIGALSRAEGESMGTYAISQGTLNNTNNTNYNISFTAGKIFTITPKSLGSGSTPAPNITCDVTETSGTYSIIVKQGGSNLTLGTDYTKGGESDGAKYYQITVTGINNYGGGFSVKFAKILLSKRAGSVAPGGAALFVSDSGDGNFVVPDNMTAYIVTGISGNTLITEQLDNIPDHVPVLLVSTIDANGFLVQPEASATPPSGTNLLVESTGTSFGTAQIYLLYKGEFVLNAAGTVPAGKIYLPRSSSAPAPVKLYIDWDFVDGIDLEKEELRVENEEYYTLDGIKLGSKPTRKGLYLHNGEKVIIR